MYLHVYIAEGTVDIAVVDLLKRKHSPMPDVTDTDTQSNSNFDWHRTDVIQINGASNLN